MWLPRIHTPTMTCMTSIFYCDDPSNGTGVGTSGKCVSRLAAGHRRPVLQALRPVWLVRELLAHSDLVPCGDCQAYVPAPNGAALSSRCARSQMRRASALLRGWDLATRDIARNLAGFAAAA